MKQFLSLVLLASLVPLGLSAADKGAKAPPNKPQTAITSAAELSPAATRAAFLKVLDRPRVPLAVQTKELPATSGFVTTQFSYAADEWQRVPGLLVKAEQSKGWRPVVIVLHGTGGNKESQAGLLKKFADKGFVAVAIDGRYHGARTKAGTGSKEYHEAILRAYGDGKEHPFFYDTVWDVMRLVDYLVTREDVDATRIGLIGFSKGGVETYLAAAIDPRIAVAVPCIGVQSFQWALDNDMWQSRVGTIQPAVDAAAKDLGVPVNTQFIRRFYDRVAPGIYGQFDGPVMLTLIAPRPLLSINGDTDARTPMPGLMLCADAAKRAYAEANASEKFVLRVQEKTGHKVNPESQEEAIAWFEKWLRP